MKAYYQDKWVTIYHGNCLDILPQLDVKIDLIATSPPYNSRIAYDGDCDQLSWDSYYSLMGDCIRKSYAVLTDGGTLAINVPLVIRWQRDHAYNKTWFGYDPTYESHRGDERTLGKGRIEPLGFRVFQMMCDIDSHVREPIIWVKGSNGNAICTTHAMGCDSDPYFRPAYEVILIGSKGRWFHRGGTGRRGAEAMPFADETKDVWHISPESSTYHPAIFPEAIPARLIQLFTHSSDAIVLDPFCGIGTTLWASKKLSRLAIGIDRSEKYCEIAARRCSQEVMELV